MDQTGQKAASNNAGQATDTSQDSGRREVLLAEYKSLRDELIKKMDHRTSYRIASITIGLTAIGIGVERRSSALLLLVPMVVLLFGSVATFQSEQIGRLAQYLRDHVERPLRADYPDAIGWHTAVRDRRTRAKQVIVIHHVPNLALAAIPTCVGFALGWSYPELLWVKVLLTVIDLALLIVFVVGYRRHWDPVLTTPSPR